MLAVSFFYYKSEQRLMFDLTKSKMQNIASKISSQIIFAHMSQSRFDTSELQNYPNYTIALYDEKHQKLLGKLNENLDFSPIQKEKGTVFNHAIKKYGHNYILLDTSTFGHLDVHYIAIKEHEFSKKIEQLQFTIILFFIGTYALIALIGFFLAKLFIQPISKQRLKINNFIKDTTHELNTPITGLLMCTEGQGEINKKNSERIRISARRISEIYKDLTYLFLQDNHANYPKENLSLDTLLKEQIEYLEPFAKKKKIQISFELETMEYLMYKEDFIRLCNNLISNAIKYNKIGGDIHIVLKDHRLSIQDSGIGINKKRQKDIFKRYYRATNVHGGFGIGLNIVKHICDSYHIQLSITSQENRGSTFTLIFP